MLQVGANPPSTLPPVLLQEVVVLALQGDARQSIFAQEMLYSVLSSSHVLLKPSQTRTILSTIWHQVKMNLFASSPQMCWASQSDQVKNFSREGHAIAVQIAML